MLENEIEGNPYPIDAFPSFFKELILELNKSLNYPIDYSATAILTAISTSIGTSVKVQVKNGWLEYASIYCCLIGSAGANKTHPINKIFEPLKHIDNINHENYVLQHKEFKEYEKLPRGEKKKVPKVEEPILKKHILTNFTPEVLFKRLNENPRGCTVISDEMVTFFESMNNYSKGDQIGNYLSMWNNQPTTIDRVSEPVPMFIKTPFLSVIGGLQPRILGSAFPVQKMNNGFFQRFLFAYPDNIYKQPINDNEIDEDLINRYFRFITDYINHTNIVETNDTINSKTLNWTDEAKNFFLSWNKKNCDLVTEYSDSIKSEILSKYDNHFIRLALILQIMENPNSNSLELNAVEGAEKLCDYYIHCSFKVLGQIQDPNTYLKSLAENKRNFYNTLNEKFTTAEAIITGLKYEITERRAKEFLNDDILFKKIKHGVYEKKIIKKV